jgi:type I restriction enzyme R subunit
VRFWKEINDEKKEFLRKFVAPLMRTRTGEDFDAMSFEINVLNLSIANLQEFPKKEKKLEMLADVIIEKVSDLPLEVNTVAKEKELIEAVLNNGYVQKADEEDLETLIEKLAPLMRFREEGIKPDQDSLDLKDVTVEKQYIEFGPHNERLTVQKYREKVEELIKKLAEENEILQKIKEGERLDSDDVEELANTLMQYEPYPTEKNLQKAYDARQVRFIDLIKYIMGIGDLVTFSDKVSAAFAEYIATHNTLTAKQIQFLQTLQTFIIENGRLEKKDLINEPFTRIHKLGIRGLFNPHEQEEILEFTNQLLTHA